MSWEQGSRSRDDFATEARQIAEILDGGNVGIAEQVLSKDLQTLRSRPADQDQLLSMVDRFDRKGFGADLQILEDRSARVIMNGYEGPRFPYGGQSYPVGDRQYPYQEFPVQQSQYDRNAQYNPYYENRSVVIVEQRPDAASRVLEGVAIGVGAAIGKEVIDSVFGKDCRSNRDRNCGSRNDRRIEPRIHYPASPHYDPRPGHTRAPYEPIPRHERIVEPRIHYPASPQHQRRPDCETRRPDCAPRITDNYSRYEHHQGKR